MKVRTLAIIAGCSYIIIFFSAIFANFFVLETILKAPLETIRQNDTMVRFGILAFILTAVFDVIVAWSVYELYKTHPLSNLSMYFRIMHATIMAIAIFALPAVLEATSVQEIIKLINTFNTIWLIGLLFFGIHLILLGNIIRGPKFITIFLIIAGFMYIVDTVAHFMLANYESYASTFLMLVAIPSIVGEMSFSIWLLAKSGRKKS